MATTCVWQTMVFVSFLRFMGARSIPNTLTKTRWSNHHCEERTTDRNTICCHRTLMLWGSPSKRFDGDPQSIRVRWQQIVFRSVVRSSQWWFDQRVFVKVFGIDLAPMNRRKDTKTIVCQTHVVAITRRARRDDAGPFNFPDQARFKGMN